MRVATDDRRRGRSEMVRIPEARVAVLGGFSLSVDGTARSIAETTQRLVSLLAISGRPLSRRYVSGILWPETQDERASASLRSALWRLGSAGWVVHAANGQLDLAREVSVDLRQAESMAADVLAGQQPAQSVASTIAALGHDVLPDRYEDWIEPARERFRQLRLHALERLSETLAAGGRFADATQAALAAVLGEPLRESAHRALIKAHLAEGNVVEALRAYGSLRSLLEGELGIRPSPETDELVVGAWRR